MPRVDLARGLGRRAYASIPHLPGSRTGPSDRHVGAGQAALCTDPEAVRPGDRVVVEEKLDGSCVAVVYDGDALLAVGREGAPAAASGNEARRWFAAWVEAEAGRLAAALEPGERLVGEWLALCHGTRYVLPHAPFVGFDLMRGAERVPVAERDARLARAGLPRPHRVHDGAPLPVEPALARLGTGGPGAGGPPEGLVWRVERPAPGGARVVLVAKYVRAGKVDGALLPEHTGAAPIHHWTPEGACSS